MLFGATFDAAELISLHENFERAWCNMGHLYVSRGAGDLQRAREVVARLVIASATVKKQKASTEISQALNGYIPLEAE